VFYKNLKIISFSTILFLSPSLVQGADGIVITIAIELANKVLELIKGEGKIAVCTKAKTDGPDLDDQAVSDGREPACDSETTIFEGALQGTAAVTAGNNDQDDPQCKIYNKGNSHKAEITLRFDFKKATEDDKEKSWRPVKLEGFVQASPEDDPTKVGQETFASAFGAFSLDGKTFEYCYGATDIDDGSDTDKITVGKIDPCPEKTSQINQNTISEEDLSSTPFLEEGAVFLASVDKFSFNDIGEGKVLIHPLFGSTIDIFHSYLQNSNNQSFLPVLRGYDDNIKELKNSIYEEKVITTGQNLSYDNDERADFTMVGVALQFDDLVIVRESFQSEYELLKQYFSSNAVRVVAPEHAQHGYKPHVTFHQQIVGGQDITEMVGYDFIVPGEGKSLVGVFLSVIGNLDEAVSLAANTNGHFVRELILSNWDGSSSEVMFRTPELNFYTEDSTTFSDVAVSSPPSCAVNLESFSVENSENTIFVKWKNGSEVNNIAMNLWCAQMQDNQFKKITRLNSEPIPSKAILPNYGASYSSTDYPYINANLWPGIQYCALEDIDASGQCVLHCDQMDIIAIGKDNKLSDIELNELQTKAIALCNKHKPDGECLSQLLVPIN
jgi:hypothetical protein